MGEKAAMIQERVDETIEETASIVVESVNSVLEHVRHVQNLIAHVTTTVDMTVRHVQETTHQPIADGKPAIEVIGELYQHPWTMLSAAMVVGYLLGAGDQSVPTVNQSTGGQHLDNLPIENATGSPFNSPSRSGVGTLSATTPEYLDRPGNPS
jgi:hypothetical protein